MILIPHYNKWKLLALWKVRNQSKMNGILWKIVSSNVQCRPFAFNGLKHAKLLLWSPTATKYSNFTGTTIR